ncbi:hypothetical protein [Streptomyces sp. NPDC017520]|uniref:hypothetical protein n=1 Tax=Streptomyces sp. NPDC017520 TaxID=3364998 RepID=UPI0037ADE983
MFTSHAPSAKALGDEPSAATRHLCSGVYVDERFRDLVIDEVCTAPYRRVAPSYGFDIVPVMRHAWRAAALTALLRGTVAGAVSVPVLGRVSGRDQHARFALTARADPVVRIA